MSSPSLLGTPLPPRNRERSAAPSPYTPAPGRRAPSSTPNSRPSQPGTSSREGPSALELKLKAQQHVAKSRIVADPSLASAFRKDVDGELWDLFVGGQ
ncbi:hypothetical protein JCM10212_006146 [Sporobolomyces blumeae]